MFNLYQGVRAGGGIGDVIEPADGDDSEVYRILFDISFFFFIIVILLAIIQGMYVRTFFSIIIVLKCHLEALKLKIGCQSLVLSQSL